MRAVDWREMTLKAGGEENATVLGRVSSLDQAWGRDRKLALRQASPAFSTRLSSFVRSCPGCQRRLPEVEAPFPAKVGRSFDDRTQAYPQRYCGFGSRPPQ